MNQQQTQVEPTAPLDQARHSFGCWGLALSGGGVRGFAHLGVLQALEEHDLKPGILAGASMGGLIAGLYGAGVPLQRLIDFATQFRLLSIASPDRSRYGLFDQHKVSQLLVDFLGSEDLHFEDLPTPVAVTAVDLERGELVVLTRGPLIPALLATSALPLFFRPVHHQGRWLIDGGVLNNVPFDIVRAMGARHVVAVAIPPHARFELEDSPELKPRGLSLRALMLQRDRLRDWRLPFLIAEMGIGMTQRLINQRRQELCPPDILLEVKIPNVGILTSSSNTATIRAGYEATTHRIDEITAALTGRPRPFRDLRRRLRHAWAALKGESPVMYPMPVAWEPHPSSDSRGSPANSQHG